MARRHACSYTSINFRRSHFGDVLNSMHICGLNSMLSYNSTIAISCITVRWSRGVANYNATLRFKEHVTQLIQKVVQLKGADELRNAVTFKFED